MKDKFGLKSSFGIAGAGVGLGIMGNAFESEGLKSAGSAAVGFVPISVNIGMGGYMINQLKGLGKKK